jgi:hypothetical protein
VSAPLDPASVKLAIETGGVAFRNPVLTASGTFGYGREFEGLTDLRALGGLVTKGISPGAALRQRDATHLRDRRRGCSTRSAWRTSASRDSSATSCRICGSAARACWSTSSAPRSTNTSRAAPALDRLDGVDAWR